MANFEKMIPFILHFAAGVYGKNGEQLMLPYEEQFDLARRRGWSDDKDDPGGATMIDVTLATYKRYRRLNRLSEPTKRDLHYISFDEWKEILKTMYWNKWRGDEIESQGLANLLVDWIWASGTGVIRNAQRVMGVKDDGIVGPLTLEVINKYDSRELFERIYCVRVDYYKRCRVAWKYFNGWLRRLNAIQPDGSFLIYDKSI